MGKTSTDNLSSAMNLRNGLKNMRELKMSTLDTFEKSLESMNCGCPAWPRKPFSVLGPSLTFMHRYHVVISRRVPEVLQPKLWGGPSPHERPPLRNTTAQTGSFQLASNLFPFCSQPMAQPGNCVRNYKTLGANHSLQRF